MKRFGLIGKTLGYSFSRKYFSNKFSVLGLEDHVYENFELSAIDEVKDLFKQSDIRGFNVTIPYKESVMDYLDQIDPAAAEIGAVNTICKDADGKLVGYNTDHIGFKGSLEGFLSDTLSQKSALILGTGGASKAVAYALKTLGYDIRFVSRKAGTGLLTYDQLTENDIRSAGLIINTTPLGTFPDVDNCPDIPYKHLTESQHLYDLVYNPEWTKFLKFGQDKSCPVQNGLRMLELQAEAAWSIWNQG